MGDVERRVVEAHSMLEKMRNEFEIEREGYAVSERDLRSKLSSESERNETLTADYAALTEQHNGLTEQHKTLQKQLDALESEIEALRAQNSSLADVYATAKRLSEELARGAGDLASTLKKTPVEEGEEGPGGELAEIRVDVNGGEDESHASSRSKASA
jgi:chromosome segregation ATPase